MTESAGVLSKAVIRKDAEDSAYPNEPVYATLIGTGASAIPIQSEAVSLNTTLGERATLRGGASQEPASQEFSALSGPVSCALSYEFLDRLWLMLLGFEHPDDSPFASGATTHTHVYEMDDALRRQDWLAGDSRSIPWTLGERKVRTFAMLVTKQVETWFYYGLMVASATITIKPNRTSVQFNVVGNNRSRSASAVPANSLADIPICLWSECAFSLGSVDGATISWQSVGASEIQIVIENPLVSTKLIGTGGTAPMEPHRSNASNVRLRVTLPRYVSTNLANNLMTAHDSETPLKANIIFSKTVGSVDYELYFGLPHLLVRSSTAATAGRSIRQPRFELAAYKPVELTDDDNPWHVDADDTWNASLHGITLRKNGALTIINENTNSATGLTEI
jgi:hypothetical protein